MSCSRIFILCLLVLIMAASTQAADLQVSVLEVLINGSAQPVMGARVCVGTEGNLSQIGSLTMNNPNGFVTFNNIQPGEYVVTVSADGYQGQQRTITLTGNTGAAAFRMERCAGTDCGPTCGGGRSLGSIRNPPREANEFPAGELGSVFLRVSSFYINNRQINLTTSRAVRLYFTYASVSSAITIKPTHYRASESEDFEGASWRELPQQEFTGDPFVNFNLSAGPPWRKTVYFQLRAGSGSTAVRSNVVRDQIDLEAFPVTNYVIQGQPLKDLLNYARQQDFTFTFTDRTGSLPACGTTPGAGAGITFPDFPPGYSEGIDFDIPGIKITAEKDVVGRRGGEVRLVEGKFFGGRQLNPGWRIVAANFLPHKLWEDSEPDTWVKIIVPPTEADSSFVVRFRFHRKAKAPLAFGEIALINCSEASVKLNSITLEGPVNGNWRDAFSSQPAP